MRVGRTALGCLVGVAALVGLMLLVRPAIFTLAPPRDDTSVVLGTSAQFTDAPQRVPVVLSRSYGLDGERPLGQGDELHQLAVIVWGSAAGDISVVAAASPLQPNCPVEIAGDRLVDCAERAWTFDGVPIDPDLPPLQRFATSVEAGTVRANLTRPLDDAGG